MPILIDPILAEYADQVYEIACLGRNGTHPSREHVSVENRTRPKDATTAAFDPMTVIAVVINLRCNKRLDAYSITSSARPSSVIGKVMPSALAVLRLRISSTFVACWTGESEGFSPLRMRAV